MELSDTLVFIPAALALLLKLGIFYFAGSARAKNRQTRLFLYFLSALAVQNLAELAHFYILHQGTIPVPEVNLYYAASILALAFLFHLTLSIAFERLGSLRWLPVFGYLYAGVLEVLLYSGSWLIKGYVPMGYSVTRIPGPLYFLFEYFAEGVFVAVIGLLIYAALRQTTPTKRLRAKTMLLGLVPMATDVFLVLILLHFGIHRINASFTLPLTITFFLMVTAYAVYKHRILDIQFFIPWSKVRQRKTAFYQRIRKLIAEIADLSSVNQAVERLAETLQCPTALIGGNRPVVAAVAGSRYMTEFPRDRLPAKDQILVANEIADTQQNTYALMKRHGIAAIVPFYPHTHAQGWLLLGDAFSDNVYMPRDFRLVEELFGKMADLFLDKLLTMRAQLSTAKREVHTLQQRFQALETRFQTLEGENQGLRETNKRLLKEQPGDSLGGAVEETENLIGASITMLGRHKELRTELRKAFPQLQNYVGPHSAGFRRQSAPDLLLCAAESVQRSAANQQLLKVLTDYRERSAFLFYSEHDAQFVAENRQALVGSLIEVAGADASPEQLIRKARALIQLRRATHGLADANVPLIGVSSVYTRLIAEVRRLSGFTDPVWVRSNDSDHAGALARAIHDASGVPGKFALLYTDNRDTDALRDQLFADNGLLAQCNRGSLFLSGLHNLAPELQRELLQAITEGRAPRVILGARETPDQMVAQGRCLAQLVNRLGGFVLEVPAPCERTSDIPLLVHYFTLQFNLQAGTYGYLSQAEVDALISALAKTARVADIKQAVFERLSATSQRTAAAPSQPAADSLEEVELEERTLDELVGGYEARIIEQTLKRCDGNKSKAARMLGLRPNTLHYKLERYGLAGPKKKG